MKELKYSATMRLGWQVVKIKKGTLAYRLYRKEEVIERFKQQCEVNSKYIKILERNGFLFSRRSSKEENIMQIAAPTHRFFIASQFHPEFTSRPLRPNSLFNSFIQACVE